MNESGLNIDIWGISLCSFTCLYSVVTTKLVVWTRWWTKVSVFFYTVMSILVYVAYVWFSNWWEGSQVRFSIVVPHQSPVFYLTVLLVGGSTFLYDLLHEYWRFTTHKTGSDYVRGLLNEKKGKGWNDEETEIEITNQDLINIDKHMKPIEKYYREQD